MFLLAKLSHLLDQLFISRGMASKRTLAHCLRPFSAPRRAAV